jgi:hypothetical protein
MENQEMMDYHQPDNEEQEVKIFGKIYTKADLEDIKLDILSKRYSNQGGLRVHIGKIDPDKLKDEDLVAYKMVNEGEWQEGNDEFKQYEKEVNGALKEKYSSDKEILEDSRKNMIMMLVNQMVVENTLKKLELRKAKKSAESIN